MTDVQALMGAVAVIVVSVIYIVRHVLIYKGKTDLASKFDHYKPYAFMAAKWVESKVPDDYGDDAEDPGIARATHKLDLFLKKFIETVEKFEGTKPTDELKKEAMTWSVELAERMNIAKFNGLLKKPGE